MISKYLTQFIISNTKTYSKNSLISIIKTQLASLSLRSKNRRFKTANVKFYLQIQGTEASHHFYSNQRSVINVEASFCA